jgi:sporulation protein YlmC with PRC-barrel domain
MLRSMKDMEDYTIGATDGVIGRVRDFYFDDEAWVIRYLVVETGEGSAQRRVLISPISIGQPNWSEKILPVSLTCAQVKGSPDIDTDKPVSRQHEMGYLGYYGYGSYWGAGGLWGAGIYPDELQAGLQKQVLGTDARHQGDDVHLRSGNEIMRYYVHASDGDIGHVQGLMVDEKSWAIRYIIVNTSNWWMGHEVLISPEWIDDVDWPESKLSIDLTRQAIKDSPPYDPKAPLSLQQEAGIHAHYGRAIYSPLKSRRPPGQARL